MATVMKIWDEAQQRYISVPAIKGKPFRYEDFTQEQLTALKGESGVYYGVVAPNPVDGVYPIWINPNGSLKDYSPPISDELATDTNPYSGSKVEERISYVLDAIPPSVAYSETQPEPINEVYPIWINPNGDKTSVSPPINDVEATSENPYSGTKVETRIAEAFSLIPPNSVYYGEEQPAEKYAVWIRPSGDPLNCSPRINDELATTENPYSGAKVEELIAALATRIEILENTPPAEEVGF